MGYDSLFLTQVAQKIQSQMKVKITFRQLLAQYSTIPSLAAFLAEKVPASAAPARAPTAAAAADRDADVSRGCRPIAASCTCSARADAPAPTAPAIRCTHRRLPGVGGLEGLFRDQLQTDVAAHQPSV